MLHPSLSLPAAKITFDRDQERGDHNAIKRAPQSPFEDTHSLTDTVEREREGERERERREVDDEIMEFPFGHGNHPHHHRRGEDEEGERREEPPLYPPPGRQPGPYGGRDGGDEYPRPPPQHYGGGGEEGRYGRPPQAGYEYGGPGYQPPVQHVAHEVSPGPYPGPAYGGVQQDYGGQFSSVSHVSHERPGGSTTANRRTVRVFTKAAENYSLSVRDGRVILARADPNDEYQHWIKDEKFSTRVKDEEGLPSFALVNKVTREAIKHSIGATHPVRLVPYNTDYLDESVLWTESYDTGEGYRCLRMVNNIRLNFDAFNGDKDHGGVHDGTNIVLWEWMKGENQRWKIVPY